MTADNSPSAERTNSEAAPDTPQPAEAGAASGQTGREWRTVLTGLRVVVSTTLLSRFLGMFRDVATGSLFGLGPVMDAFAFAFRIPNLARRLFGEGALTAAFLPAFARALEQCPDPRNRTSAWQLASGVLGVLAFVLSALVTVSVLALLALRSMLPDQPETQLLLSLTAIMLPYAVLICVAAQVTAILQALDEFAWPAMVPVVLNVFWIASIYLVDPWFEPDRVAQSYALAVCVVIAGILQLSLQIPPLYRRGFRWSWSWTSSRRGVTDIAMAMVPVTLGLSITQLTTVFDSGIAWLFSQPADPAARMALPGAPAYPLTAGAVSALYFGERLYHFPLGVFGVALGTVLFPRLSRHAARNDRQALREDLGLGLRLVLVIGLPASVGLWQVAEPLTRLIYAHGEFTVENAQRTARMVEAYAWGVWAYCAIPILQRGFFALGDRIGPLRIGMMALAIDVVLNITLIWPLAERGLAWSTALSSIGQVAALCLVLSRRVDGLPVAAVARTAGRAAVSTLGMALAVWGLSRLDPRSSSTLLEAAYVALMVGVGGGVYLAIARVIGLNEVAWLLRGRGALLETDTPRSDPAD